MGKITTPNSFLFTAVNPLSTASHFGGTYCKPPVVDSMNKSTGSAARNSAEATISPTEQALHRLDAPLYNQIRSTPWLARDISSFENYLPMELCLGIDASRIEPDRASPVESMYMIGSNSRQVENEMYRIISHYRRYRCYSEGDELIRMIYDSESIHDGKASFLVLIRLSSDRLCLAKAARVMLHKWGSRGLWVVFDSIRGRYYDYSAMSALGAICALLCQYGKEEHVRLMCDHWVNRKGWGLLNMFLRDVPGVDSCTRRILLDALSKRSSLMSSHAPAVDHFVMLGLDPKPTYDAATIKTAFQDKIRQHHPDVHASKKDEGLTNVATDRTQKLIEARNVLLDPGTCRQHYEAVRR